MRKALITAVALGAALTLPAAAFADQNQYRGQYRCKGDKDDQVAGALIGGVLGGLLGSQVAGHGDRTEGAVGGAVVGGVLGAVVADGKGCKNKRYGKRRHNRRYYNNTGYNSGYYNNGYNQSGYNRNYGYNNDPYANERRQYRRHERRERRNARRYENRRNGFWNERLEGGYYKQAGYNKGYNAQPYSTQKCRYRNITTRDGYGNRVTKQVKECRSTNGTWTRH